MSGKGSRQRPTNKKCFDANWDRIFGRNKVIPIDMERLQQRLEKDEGVRYAVYLDHLGYKTVGIGHLIVEEDQEYGKDVGYVVSADRVTELFQKDLHTCMEDCKALYPDFQTWPAEVQEILLNMAFNLGRTRLAKFVNFKAALEKRDWKQAAIEGRDSRWYRQVTNRAERLMTELENIA